LKTEFHEAANPVQNPVSIRGDRGRIDWRQVGILYQRELRAALREKNIVINSLLMPIFLYPFVLWIAFTGMIFVQGQTEGFISRVAVSDWPKNHPALRRDLKRNDQLQWVDPQKVAGKEAELIKEGKLDLFIEFLPPDTTNASLPGNFQARLTFNKSKERSATARDRVVATVEQYRADWLKREGIQRGISPKDWQGFSISTRNLASGKQMGAFVLGLMLPLLFVVMVAVGCFYPAVDATAGERERNTWETLMSTAATRLSIVTAKYLYVASLGGLAGILNLAAMSLSIKPILSPLLAKAGETMEYSLPLKAIPVMFLAALLLSGFVAAGMMIFAAFARTFKEGQAMITPFYMLIMLPIMFLQAPGLKFSVLLAVLPIVNVTMMVREAISGTFQWTLIVLTVLVSVALIAGCVRLATFILQFEDVMLGSYHGSFNKFFRERIFRRTRPVRRPTEVTP
jgi:sodium transport system permease protein